MKQKIGIVISLFVFISMLIGSLITNPAGTVIVIIMIFALVMALSD